MENRPRPSRRPVGAGASGPQEQLAAAYDQQAPALYRYALMLLADASAAEDAVHEVFAKLAARGERILEIASRDGYLRSAVRNECYRILRRRGRVCGEALASQGILEPADGQVVEQEQKRALERAVASLPAEQREVVHMKVYEEMTFRQIADELGVSINTAASRYRYALGKLRLLLVPGRSKGGHAHG